MGPGVVSSLTATLTLSPSKDNEAQWGQNQGREESVREGWAGRVMRAG